MSQQPSQQSLDRVVIFGKVEEIRKVVEELKERIVRVEVDLTVIESGYHAIYNALEINGLMAAGEPVKISDSNPKSEPRPEPKAESWNHAKIKWTTAQGTKGEYEKSEDVNNPEFKAMLKDLAAHKGKLSRDGYFFWVFTNGATVGRKKRGTTAT